MSFHVDVVELAEFSGILALVCLIPDIRHATIAKDARGDFFKELGRSPTLPWFSNIVIFTKRNTRLW